MRQQNGWRRFILNTEKDNDIKLTVFTPAYNRGHTLPRTYESLKKQDCKDFIWLIVDDGSADNTGEIVSQWIKAESKFEIRYVYKENGGMHTAHNTAYENIDTELNVCIDSDDAIETGAVRKILDKWESIKDKDYAGIIALDADMNTGKIIGKGFPTDMKETTLSGYYNAGGSGDKKVIYRTDVIKKYPEYPVFEGEKYVSLSYKYLLIDQEYKLSVLDDVVCLVEYQPEGSTNSMFKQYLNNPKGFAFWRTIRMKYNSSFKRTIVDCIHYCSSSIIAKNKQFIKESPKPILTILCIPLGLLLTYYVKKKAKS